MLTRRRCRRPARGLLVAFVLGMLFLVPGAASSAAVVSGWEIVSSPSPDPYQDYLSSVSCASPTSCTAVGGYGNPNGTLVETWNGSSWAVTPSPNLTGNTNQLFGVSCVSGGSCMSVGTAYACGLGNCPLSETWNGAAWSVVPTPDPGFGSLFGVSCVASDSCTAVGVSSYYLGGEIHLSPQPIHQGFGAARTLVEVWDGARWAVVPSPDVGSEPNFLSGVSCAGPDWCVAVGSYLSAGAAQTLVEAWNGATWTVVPSPDVGTNDSLSAVSCVSASACTAVGSSQNGGAYETLVEAWDGTSWKVEASPDPGSQYDVLAGVSCVVSSSCITVGWDASSGQPQTLVEAWDGTGWSAVSSPNAGTSDSLVGVSCVPGFCAGVGSSDGIGATLIEDVRLLPTSTDQCKDGGWQTFGVFKNQGDCVSYVATDGRNPPNA